MQSNEVMIAALLSNRSIEAAAKSLNVSTTTLKKYMKEPDFIAEYKNARADLLQSCYDNLIAGVNEAIETVREVMKSKDSSQQTKLNAAQVYLNTTLRLNEQVDIMQDLAEIKARLEIVENE